MTEVKRLKTREEIASQYKWNIEKVYKDSRRWEEDFQQLKIEALKLKEFPGTLSDPKNLIAYLNLKEKISRKAEVLFVYAHLKSDEDTANTEFQTIKEKIDGYLAELSSINAFFVPEILSLNEEELLKNIDEIQELNMYKFFFKQIIIMKPHTLSRELEEMLASVSDCLEAPGNIFGMLTNADMTFPNIKDENNKEVELTEVNYATFIRSKDRRVREEAFKALFNTYSKFKNTLTSSLTSSVKNFIFVSKANKYESSLESSLKPNNIPVEVYYKSIDTINKNLDSLHRYVSVKKRLLGLDEMHMYDLYVPVIDIPKEHIEFEEAIKIVKEGLKPLGEEYLSIFKEGVDNGWVDVFENKGKRGGAYSWGCHDTMPYVLLNYNYSINDVSTFAHEMGHSIHSYYSRKNQPQVYSNYTLFCAEVASTTNEALLIHHLINKEEDENKKLYLINQELEQIRTTVFRQLMFAEFEILVHESIENGKPLNSKDLCSIWHDLNVKYFGPDMIVDEGIDMEWARIPHFYSDFYVYQYATGYAAASAFAKTILEDNENALEKYKGFLKSGGSDYPINILKTAGVDMTTSKPLEATIARFNELLDMLEK
ncbi:oligoendopeptidase F [Clostridium algidicarnis]|uniref:oligoendopeptidase F n=1 Tax=Clostridium algidicarnis TaxID=37659 RepID=UPI000495F10B|nr:oligoendopeptidase F [Clostridium algidicarnis]